jgi:cytidine deaminase
MADPRLDGLVAAARAARVHAHAPFSGFAVGAAIVTASGTFTGVNVENASYPLSMCAERNAVAAMVAAGEGAIDAIAIVTDAPTPTPPCGGCRQVLWSFGSASTVVAETLDGKRSVWALRDLLPSAFGEPG